MTIGVNSIISRHAGKVKMIGVFIFYYAFRSKENNMNNFNLEEFGNRIIKLREKNGKSQEEICTELGVTQQTLSRYEKGQRQASLDFVYKASKYFNVSADYILGLSRAAAPDNFVQEVVNRYGLTESALKTLEHLNAPLDFDEKEKNRIVEKQKYISDSIENGKIPLIKSLTEEEKSKLFSVFQLETNKQILSILNDILTVSTGREWETYGMQILNTIYNYCRGEYENVKIKRNDFAGTTYYEISADTQRNMELNILNNILTEMRKVLTTEEDLPLYTTSEMIKLGLLPEDFDEFDEKEDTDNAQHNPSEE